MLCALCGVLFGTAAFVCLAFTLGWWTNGHFRRQGVKNPPAYFPIIGNMMGAITRTIHFKDFVHNMYKDYPDEKYVGFYQFVKPVLLLRDIELIKLISIKEFEHFQDRGAGMDETADPIFGKSLMSLHGQKWREMRATLSPAFTSSKMRGMFQFIIDCGQQMANHYQKTTNTCINRVRGIIEVEMKEAYTRYTNDVIATCAFGQQVNSFKDMDNTFYKVGADITNFEGLRFFKMFFLGTFPKIAKMLNVQFLSKYTVDFFRSLIWDTIKDREERQIVRPDMIHLLNEARKGNLKHDLKEDGNDTGFATVEESDVAQDTQKTVWSDDDIVAQAVLFLLAGFDTTSTALSFLTHEIALHTEIQRKLQREIDEVAASYDGKITYDCLQKMQYLDMVVSESLRMWPPSPITDRKCTKDFTFPPPNKDSTTGFHMKTNEVLWVPTYGIHHDPKYWENPHVFDPERFSEENKKKIQPGTYMPFGMGPRNCIGSRFALIELKAIIYNLLLRFDFMTTAKTQNPIKLDPNTFTMKPERGFWIGLRPRYKRLPSNQCDPPEYA